MYLVRRGVLQGKPYRAKAVFHLRRAGLRPPPSKKSRFARRFIALFLALVFAGGVALTVWPRLYLPSLDFVFDSARISLDSRVRRLQPAVVTLTVLASPGQEDPPRFLVQQRGTGFNIDPGGLVVTNSHVVQDARRLVVRFPDGSVFSVENSYVKPECDLAVLTLADASGLPVAHLGNSDLVVEGDKIFVVGNPLGIDKIAVTGVAGRRFHLSDCASPALELFAPIHPGNSGSPVMDVRGEVVGVVFATVKVEDGDRGLAISSNCVREFLQTVRGS
jgi:S1-C subfamily serine protease